jgi:bacillithiol biosynthesis cysteine-adding enzyme BshC
LDDREEDLHVPIAFWQGLITSGIFEAYTAGDAGAFFDGHFADLRAWERVRRVARPLVPSLASALETQNARYEKSPARDAHVRALGTGATAVVTGQQTGLFLGPLYTVYKAASTVRLARWLTNTWGTPVVPVFWLQTEDHDAAEISVCHVAGGQGSPLTLTLPVSAEPIPVAHRVLPASIAELLATLGDAISRLPHGEEHLMCLARHYTAGAGWGQAFAGVLATLFAPEGLVLIDPRDPVLAPLASPVHRRALTESRPIARALTARVQALADRGWRAGVHVREDAPLSFFHPDGPEGPRCRLAAADAGFVEVGRSRTHTIDELLRVLDTSPAAFSTSALLRPILQDTWLPTVAYVGGPGEIAYSAQLAPLYAAFDVTMPIVVPRVQLRLTDHTTRRTLARHGLTPAQACHPLDDVLAMVDAEASREPGGDRLAQRVIDGIDRALADVAPLVREAGDRAERALEKTRRTMARTAGKLGHSYDRARHLRHRDVVDDLRRVQASLQPRGIPQERFFGLPSYAARFGQRGFVERVLAAAEPLSIGIKDLAL